MRQTMKTTIQLLKAYNVLDLMRGLVNRGLALTCVNSLTKKMCSGMVRGGRDRPKILAEKIMKWKLSDAGRVVRERRETNTKVWRENEPVLRDHQVSERFFRLWEEEKVARRRELEAKRERKVAYLIRRSKEEKGDRQRREVGNIRGINVSDN